MPARASFLRIIRIIRHVRTTSRRSPQRLAGVLPFALTRRWPGPDLIRLFRLFRGALSIRILCMNPTPKFHRAFDLAARTLEKRPDQQLARIAKTGRCSIWNTRQRDQFAASFEDREHQQQWSWPEIGYFSPETTALTAEEIALLFVRLLDDLDSRGEITRDVLTVGESE